MQFILRTLSVSKGHGGHIMHGDALLPISACKLGPRICDLPATSAGPTRYESNSFALHLEERVKNGQVRTMLLTIPSIAEMLGGADWLPAVYS